jgi:hypothetical protein
MTKQYTEKQFMQLTRGKAASKVATAMNIHVRGYDWRGSSKSMMAEHWAHADIPERDALIVALDAIKKDPNAAERKEIRAAKEFEKRVHKALNYVQYAIADEVDIRTSELAGRDLRVLTEVRSRLFTRLKALRKKRESLDKAVEWHKTLIKAMNGVHVGIADEEATTTEG